MSVSTPTTAVNPISARLRAQIETIERKRGQLLADRNENTPKRQCQAMSARAEAGNLLRIVRAMTTLADAHDAGACPAEYTGYRTRAAIEPLVTKIIEHPSYYVVCEGDRFRDESPAAEKFREWIAARSGDKYAERDNEIAKIRKIKQLEECIRFQPIPGFFPTPRTVIDHMLDAAGIESWPRVPSFTVLEPSAGKGDILEAIIERTGGVGSVSLRYCEINSSLWEICYAKTGLTSECPDFLKYDGHGFDRVIMNPPFEKRQDIEHVRKAYYALKPGGMLVALMSPGSFYSANGKVVEFRDWFDRLKGTCERLEDGAFKRAFNPTSVVPVMVTMTA